MGRPQGHEESDMTKQLTLSLSCVFSYFSLLKRAEKSRLICQKSIMMLNLRLKRKLAASSWCIAGVFWAGTHMWRETLWDRIERVTCFEGLVRPQASETTTSVLLPLFSTRGLGNCWVPISTCALYLWKLRLRALGPHCQIWNPFPAPSREGSRESDVHLPCLGGLTPTRGWCREWVGYTQTSLTGETTSV